MRQTERENREGERKRDRQGRKMRVRQAETENESETIGKEKLRPTGEKERGNKNATESKCSM